MLNIKNIISLIFLILISFPSFGGDIKISCNINLETTYSFDESIKKSHEEEIFTITEINGYVIIVPSLASSKFSSISTHKENNTISIKNRSDINKWDITISDKNSGGEIDDVSYLIDRNTGKIFYSLISRHRGQYSKDLGYGNCEPVDMNKKKF